MEILTQLMDEDCSHLKDPGLTCVYRTACDLTSVSGRWRQRRWQTETIIRLHARWFSDKLNVRGKQGAGPLAALKSWGYHKLLMAPRHGLPLSIPRSFQPSRSSSISPSWLLNVDRASSLLCFSSLSLPLPVLPPIVLNLCLLPPPCQSPVLFIPPSSLLCLQSVSVFPPSVLPPPPCLPFDSTDFHPSHQAALHYLFPP